MRMFRFEKYISPENPAQHQMPANCPIAFASLLSQLIGILFANFHHHCCFAILIVFLTDRPFDFGLTNCHYFDPLLVYNHCRKDFHSSAAVTRHTVQRMFEYCAHTDRYWTVWFDSEEFSVVDGSNWFVTI